MYGARSVLNLAHGGDQIEAVTERQLAILIPQLRSQLNGHERVVLDFGCGTGRFSGALAEATGGRVIAADPVQQLLDLAPKHRGVEYHLITDTLPLEDHSIDVVWICLVLGAIVDRNVLLRAVSEIDRVLAPEGLLFLVENTADKKSLRHFHFRSEEDYAALFPSVDLRPVSAYEDAGERISVLAGRKRPAKMEIRSPRSS